MMTDTIRPGGALTTPVRLLLFLQAGLLSVPTAYVLFSGVKGAGDQDELTSELSVIVIVVGLVLGALVLALAACAYGLPSGKAARYGTPALEAVTLLACVPPSLAGAGQTVMLAFPVTLVLAIVAAVLLGVSGRR
ncbi:hypothetical protein AB0L06_28295 [Spirillospora sp. NPDC052269]